MRIDNEADFKTQELIDLVNKIYKKWDIEISIEDYRENDRMGNKDRFYFIAKKVIITTKLSR